MEILRAITHPVGVSIQYWFMWASEMNSINLTKTNPICMFDCNRPLWVNWWYIFKIINLYHLKFHTNCTCLTESEYFYSLIYIQNMQSFKMRKWLSFYRSRLYITKTVPFPSILLSKEKFTWEREREGEKKKR